MAITFGSACLVVLFNLLADLLYGRLDPRITYRSRWPALPLPLGDARRPRAPAPGAPGGADVAVARDIPPLPPAPSGLLRRRRPADHGRGRGGGAASIYRVPIDEIDFKAKLPPSAAHPLGTDYLGQDLLARMLYGGRISLAVGIAAMLIAVIIGVSVGAAAGHFAGVVDHALMRVTDLFLSLPQLPLLLLIVYLFRDA